jgi:hypothetical protein
MTTIQQQMQTGPVKANEIFAKLTDTSAAAIKTRDQLISELKIELDRQAEFEEQRLFPVLKKHKETKDLVSEALSVNQKMHKLLAELERMPKDSDAFAAKAAELRDMFQRHLRDDKKEILPVIVKALSDEEASAIAGKTENGKAPVAPARRADGGERQAGGELQAVAAARPSSDTLKADIDAAPQGVQVARVAERPALEAPGERDRGSRSMTALEETHGMAQNTGRAFAGRSMMELLNEQAHHVLQAQTAMAAGRIQTLAEIAQVQSAFMASSFKRMGQINDRYLALIRRWTMVPFLLSARR